MFHTLCEVTWRISNFNLCYSPAFYWCQTETKTKTYKSIMQKCYWWPTGEFPPELNVPLIHPHVRQRWLLTISNMYGPLRNRPLLSSHKKKVYASPIQPLVWNYGYAHSQRTFLVSRDMSETLSEFNCTCELCAHAFYFHCVIARLWLIGIEKCNTYIHMYVCMNLLSISDMMEEKLCISIYINK